MDKIKEFLKNVTWHKEVDSFYFSATLDMYTDYMKMHGTEFHDDWGRLSITEQNALIQEFTNM